MEQKRTGRLGQIKVYTGKFFRIFIHEKEWKVILFALIISLLMSVVLSGSMFTMKERTREGLFAIVSSCIWIGIFNSIQTICRERQIIKREHRTGLHITSYVAAHLIYQGVICMIQAASMVLIYGMFTQFPKEGLVTGVFFIDLFITFFLVLYASDVLGLAVSSLVKTTTAAMTVMPFVLIVQLIFSGSIFPLTGAAKTVSDLTISKWGQRVLCIEANLNELPSELLDSELEMLNEMELVQEMKELLPEETVKEMDDAVEDELQKFLYEYTYRRIYTYDPKFVIKRWGYLVLFTAIYALVCVISLEFVDKDKR